MHGDYRKLFARPENITAAVCKFEGKDEEILDAFGSIEEAASKHQKGPHCALLLQFWLQKSSYATMLIREFCHISSSFEIQELINQTVGDAVEEVEDEKEQEQEQEQEE